MGQQDLLTNRRIIRGQPHRVRALTISILFHVALIATLFALACLYHSPLVIMHNGSAAGAPVITLEPMVIAAPPALPTPPAPPAPPVPATASLPVKVTPLIVGADGTVSQNGAPLGQLELVDFADPNLLDKASNANFSNPDPQTIKSQAAANAQVAQGKLESSNASPTESAARLVMLMRNFEMLQKAIKIGGDMNSEAIQEVAKVGS